MTRLSGGIAAADNGVNPPPPPPPPPPGDRLLVPSSGVWFGATPSNSAAALPTMTTLAAFETMTGRALQVVRFYASGGIWAPWFVAGSREKAFSDAGYMLAFSAKFGSYTGSTVTSGFSWAQVAAGLADATLQARADELAAIDKPMWLCFHHESDTGESDGVTHPTYGLASDFAAAWRRAYNIFASTCPKVIFTLCYGGYKTHTTWWTNSWPGDAYVDWIASDPYALSADGSNPVSNEQSSSTFRNWATVTKPGRHDFPWAIWETGCYDNPVANGSLKGAWFDTNLAWFKTMPSLKMYLYSNQGALRADTTPVATTHWQSLAADPYMTATL